MKTQSYLASLFVSVFFLLIVLSYALHTETTTSAYPVFSSPPPSSPQPGLTPKVYLPLILKQPYAAKSHYMNVPEVDFDPYALGQTDAQEHKSVIESGARLVYVLAWGQPCKVPNTNAMGAYAYDTYPNCHQLSELQTYIQQYLDGYCAKMQSLRSGGANQNCGYQYNPTAIPIIIALGVDNCAGGTGCANPDTDPSNVVTNAHGAAWGAVVQSVATYVANSGYSYQIFITGAMDIEGAWNTYASTKTWLDGYKTTSSRNFYNYGDCNCPEGYSSSNNNHIGPPLFQRDWSYDRIHEVTYRGLPLHSPLPQIYHTTGSNARQWQGLSKWAVVNGRGKMIFQELLTELGACSQVSSCTGINNSPSDAINQMRSALDADTQTAGGLSASVRSTDINWYPRP